MSEREFLDAADLKSLTGAVRAADQAQVLESHGIPFRLMKAGRREWLVVSRAHVREWLAGRPVVSRRPNMGAVR